MKRLVVVAAVVLGSAVAWFLASPLFVDQAVEEAFPDWPSSVEIAGMDKSERDAAHLRVMDEMAQVPDQKIRDDMPDTQPVLQRSGQFRSADKVHQGAGEALLYRLPDGSQLLRFEDFRVTNGPALVVYLARHANPDSAADVSDNGFHSLGPLKGNVGSQNYHLPAELDVSEFHSVVIWCELFGVLFSPAPLAAAAAPVQGT